MRPLCFVLMPFGKKKDSMGGADIDFDAIYNRAIRTAIVEAGLEPIRADEERVGGIIHKPMFERLILCDYAIADLTCANANVFYELGIRHAVRPRTTLPIFAKYHQIPFDTHFLKSIPYTLDEHNRFLDEQAETLKLTLIERLNQLRKPQNHDIDSPIFQLLQDYRQPDISHIKTDIFRERVELNKESGDRLAQARLENNLAAILEVENGLGPLADADVGVLIDLLLSYRAMQAWDKMCALCERMPPALKRMIMVREQWGLALNRLGKDHPPNRQQALKILEEIVKEHGPSSEALGLMGRVYKDLWNDAVAAGKDQLAKGYLSKAAETYQRGFETDWRDAFPGINAVTLLDILGDDEALVRKAELAPVVAFSVKQRLKSAKPDYWDYATLLELAVHANDETLAHKYLTAALPAICESFGPKTTANNLELIRRSRIARGQPAQWLDDIIDELNQV